MKTTTFYFTSKDNLEIHVYKWLPEDETTLKGIVQIAHGMAETAVRYERFAAFLVAHGYGVYINDHRGHGKTAGSVQKLGYLGDKGGFRCLVDDLHHLTKLIKRDYPNLPVFLFSHSMGSFAGQAYIMGYGEELAGVVLSGTNGKRGFVLDAGLGLVQLELLRKAPTEQTPFIDKVIFGANNKHCKPARTKVDWLSRDEKEVDKYVADPYCGTTFTVGFFRDFLTALKFIEQKDNVDRVPKDLPIYIFAGDEDPVGNYGKGIVTLYNTYKEAGCTQVSYKLYPGGRHEMLNEINRDEVMQDVVDWLDAWYAKEWH